MKIKKLILATCLFSSVLVNGAGLSLNANIDVKPFCTTSVEDLDFGIIQLKNSTEEFKATATVSTQCNYGTDVLIDFNSGNNGSGISESTKRFMSNADGAKLEYNLFYEDKILGSIKYVQEKSLESRVITGVIDLNQKAPEGNYMDVVIVNFIFE